MAFTLTPIAAKDSAGTAIGGGLMAADVAGGGVGPFFLFNGLVDGLAGSNRAQVTTGNALKVDILAAAASVAKAEDVASADADVGIPAMAVRKVTPANTSSADGDYEMLQMSAGRLWTNSLIGDGTNTLALVQDTAGTNVWAVPVMIHPDSSGIMPSAALTAATAPATGIATLGQYNATNPAPTDTQTVALQVDPNGKLLVQPYGNPANYISGLTTQMTGTTSTAVTGMGAPGAGLRNYITQVTLSNAHATVGTEISLQDGSGGTSFYTFPAAAVYGGAAISFPAPLRQPTANTGLFAVNLTTGAATKVSASGYKGA